MKSLIIRSFLWAINLNIIAMLLLFIPAGSIFYWQAWLYLLNFNILTLIITVYLYFHDKNLLASRMEVWPWAEKRKKQKIIQVITSISLLLVFISAGLDFRYDWSQISRAVILFWNLLVLLGFIIIFLTFRVNTFTRGTIEVSDWQKLISHGPYSLVRHPMYSGGILWFIWTALALWSYIALIFSFLVILFMYLRSLDEEEVLKSELDGYREYVKKVSFRFIPFIW
jgi:protein-S-isoprenylcysteine O-methyltransferase Ste14